MRICFWNTNKNKNINPIINDIVGENNIDILILAEYDGDTHELIKITSKEGMEFEEGITAGCDRIVILSRSYTIEPGFQNKYCSIQIIPGKYILVGLHLPSQLWADQNKRGITIKHIVEEIHKYENSLQIEKTIVIGDINENPYEMGCLGATQFHAVPIYNEAKKTFRTIMGEQFKMFYNPMWNLLGDFSFPPGTYYYSGNEVVNAFWNIYDQVMFRPCLRDSFVDEELKILYRTKNIRLIDDNDHPLKNISDHLPIIVEFREVD